MRALSILLLFLFAAPLIAQKKVHLLQVPGAAEYCRIQPGGHSVLPSGRYVQPAGQAVRITRAPYGLALAPDGQRAVVLHHSGVVTVIDLQHPEQAVRVPSYDSLIKPLHAAPFLGAVFAADSKTAYLSGGDQGNVLIFNSESYKKTGEIDLNGLFNGQQFDDSWTSDLAIDRQRNGLFVLDRGNNRLVKIDLITQKILFSTPVGRIPFGVALSPDGAFAFVANVGLYNYPLVPGVTPTNGDTMMLKFPPYAAHSREAQAGVTLPDGRFIPGLGEALAEEAMSVWVINTQTGQVTGKFKTGYQIGEKIEGVEIVGGASPNSVAVGSRFAYVSNASNDLISVIDYRKSKVVKEIKLKFHKRLDKYRGLMPFGCSLSPDETTLYVALLGLNAVAVVDVRQGKVRGYIPTGWGTTRVAVSNDGRQLYILSARGYGAGPNGGKGFVEPPQGTYIGDIQLGLFQTVPVPDAAQLAAMTRQVRSNTFRATIWTDNARNPCPPRGELRASPIKHILYITKENRTFDEVLGQLPGANGDATLARFGNQVTIMEGKDTVRLANVAPNHLKIARQWAFSDNFYCDSDASIHGHHWMVGTLPNEYVEANSAASARLLPFSKAPGRRFPRTAGGTDPEDYNESGGLWENLRRHGI
ncbi:MAG: phosphoesterase, partial [Saprospiraceae bacterium]